MATDQAWNTTNLAGKRYSVGKVRIPAGLSNDIPADAMLSIERQFCVCQAENDTLFGGTKGWRSSFLIYQAGGMSVRYESQLLYCPFGSGTMS